MADKPKLNEIRIYPDDRLYKLLKKGAAENARKLAPHTVHTLKEHFGLNKTGGAKP